MARIYKLLSGAIRTERAHKTQCECWRCERAARKYIRLLKQQAEGK